MSPLSRSTSIGLVSALLALLAACSAPSSRVDREPVEALASNALGRPVAWPEERDARVALERELDALLAEPLEVDGAVRIALYRNESLRAELARLGVDAAELARSHTLANPSLSASLRFERGTEGVGVPEFALTRNLLDLFMRPARVELAADALTRARIELVQTVVQHAFAARDAYFRARAARHLLAVETLATEAADVGFELMRRLHDAGNASERELALEEAAAQNARVALSQAAEASDAAREALNRELGLWGADAQRWTVPETLPSLDDSAPPAANLEAYALTHRLDLRAAIAHADGLAASLGFERRWSALSFLGVGIVGERDGGEWSFGPEIELELPIFDRGEARVAELRAELEASEHELAARAIAIRSEVREAERHRQHALARARHFRERIVPAQQRVLDATQKEFNFMLVGAFELLDAKRAELEASRGAIEALRDAWLADSELARVLGAPLPGATPPEPPATTDGHDDAHAEHDHGG
ncbi:MAG: TolC family protein [Planctomycetes bacterium]|nr:TolC family protein [Planctomycetota bacterium]